MRVLVADDDPYSAAVLEAVLTSAGHPTIAAFSTPEVFFSPESRVATSGVLFAAEERCHCEHG